MNQAAALTPQELLMRWDAQQTAYIKHRDQRFQVMVDSISRLRGHTPRVLDLACGPGSLSAAILANLPGAEIVAVDKDPILLALANDIFIDRTNVRVIEGDLDLPDWIEKIDGKFDAVVSSTALHWLNPQTLSRLYFQLAEKITEGGLFLNADHLLFDAVAQPTLRALAEQDDQFNQEQAFGNGTDTWDGWWSIAEGQPRYVEAARRRAIIWRDKTAPLKVTLGYHLETLRSAGFQQAGTIWQHLDDYVICAVR